MLQVEIDTNQLVVSQMPKKKQQYIFEGKTREIELLIEVETRFHESLSISVTGANLKLRFIERWDGPYLK